MKKPTKPRVPRKPRKPVRYKYDTKYAGRIQASRKLLSLADFVELATEKAARKLKVHPSEIPLDNVVLSDVMVSVYNAEKYEVEGWQKKNTKYLDRAKNYKKKLTDYQEKLKQYEINLELYNAWLVKLKEDKLRNKMKKIEQELKSIEKEKKALLEVVEEKE